MIHLGNSLEVLKTLESNSVDSCVTDPPYELGFMGKAWDSTGIAYNVALWQEVYRVLKPGAHLLAFGGTRTYHRMACAIEDAGFEIRDQMQWLYASGFPKSHNLKDKWQGWGTALKPANEPICVARKPFNCTVAENVLQWGTGAINVDAGRLGVNENDVLITEKRYGLKAGRNHVMKQNEDAKYEHLSGLKNVSHNPMEWVNKGGRWPANVLLSDEAAKMLDEQSGELCSKYGTSKAPLKNSSFLGSSYADDRRDACNKFIGDSGGASRFFYVAKASKSEREAGLDGFSIEKAGGMQGRQDGSLEGEPVTRANHHPTVKPIKLMEYLIKLVTPPNGIVLDPFMGSGTTGAACGRLGFEFVGIELDPKYYDIAKARFEHMSCENLFEEI